MTEFFRYQTSNEVVASGPMAQVRLSELTVDGSQAYSIPDGDFEGQIKNVAVITAINTPVATITIPHFHGVSPIVLTAVGEGFELAWHDGEWHLTPDASPSVLNAYFVRRGPQAAGSVAAPETASATGGTGDVAIGDGASSVAPRGVAIGQGAQALGAAQGPVAIGGGSKAQNDSAIAIGREEQATGVGSVAIGVAGTATAENSISVGTVATASAIGAICVGASSLVNAAGAIGIGNTTGVQEANAIGVGNNIVVDAGATAALALGEGAHVSGPNAQAYGAGAAAAANQLRATQLDDLLWQGTVPGIDPLGAITSPAVNESGLSAIVDVGAGPVKVTFKIGAAGSGPGGVGRAIYID